MQSPRCRDARKRGSAWTDYAWTNRNTAHPSRVIPGVELLVLRQLMWTILRHNGIPTKVVNLNKNSYERTGCRVILGGQLTNRFEMKLDKAACCPRSYFFCSSIG